jgi:hypothetical protein
MRKSRLVVVVFIILAGVALLPYIGLPSEKFRWQTYASAYELPNKVYLPIISKG